MLFLNKSSLKDIPAPSSDSLGFKIEKMTYNLAEEKDFWNGESNIETEHEKMFKEQGIKIKALIASKF